MAFSRLSKLSTILSRARFRSALLRHRVAATTEHLEAIRFCAPAALIDVGANKGQFSLAVRGLFPTASIDAMEPLPVAADTYAAVFKGDARTRLHRIAVGAVAQTATFHVADREDSSSLLPVGAGQRAAFGIGEARQIDVQVAPLDTVVELSALPRPSLLKIDVQGAELDVLKGIADFGSIDFIYVELSFVELYDGQALFEDVRAFLTARGYTLRGVFNQGLTDAFGPTQADCLFVAAR